MANLIITYWRDIPSAVSVKIGRKEEKRMLDNRFMEAIDMAAMRDGATNTDDYLADWRRSAPVAVSDDMACRSREGQGRSRSRIHPGQTQDPHRQWRQSPMTHTLVASATREHIIGFDRPFTVIGERINPTGRKKLAAEMQAGNFETVIKDALAQMAAGAHILDVNAGVTAVNPNETEPPLMRQTLEIVLSVTDLPLCIDSSVTSALKVGLETAKGRPLVNSVTGEEEKLEAILPLVAKYNVPVVAISNDETGISEDPDVRFAVAKKIVERAADYRHQAA